MTPKLREMASSCTARRRQASARLAAYSDEELELLIAFMRAGVAFQEEKMRRLDELIAARSAEGGRGVVAVSADEIRELAASLPRSYEVFVHGRIKFRVGQIVWLAFSKDGTSMGCGFPKEFREAAVEAEPEKFALPGASRHARSTGSTSTSRRSTRRRCATSSRRPGRGACRSTWRMSTPWRAATSDDHAQPVLCRRSGKIGAW